MHQLDQQKRIVNGVVESIQTSDKNGIRNRNKISSRTKLFCENKDADVTFIDGFYISKDVMVPVMKDGSNNYSRITGTRGEIQVSNFYKIKNKNNHSQIDLKLAHFSLINLKNIKNLEKKHVTKYLDQLKKLYSFVTDSNNKYLIIHKTLN